MYISNSERNGASYIVCTIDYHLRCAAERAGEKGSVWNGEMGKATVVEQLEKSKIAAT